jgi:hypothetical protein
MRLPAGLAWSAHRGETDPVLGWYSPRFGVRVPVTTLVGEGRTAGTLELGTTLDLSRDAKDLLRNGAGATGSGLVSSKTSGGGVGHG